MHVTMLPADVQWLLWLTCLLLVGIIYCSDGKYAEKFSLTLTNTGPSVLDSTLTFHAALTVNGKQWTGEKQFIYQWEDTNEWFWHITNDDYTSHLSKVYHSSSFKSGNYSMKVKVFKSHQSILASPIAHSLMTFDLTDNLNADVQASQVVPYGRKIPNTVSTSAPFQLAAIVFDNLTSPTFNYSWTIDGLQQNSSAQDISCHIQVPGHYKVNLSVNSSFTDEKKMFSKFGSVDKIINVKDPVKSPNVPFNSLYTVGSTVHGNVTCSASPPMSLCWSLKMKGRKSPPPTCTFSKQICSFPVYHQFNKSGIYFMEAKLINDINYAVIEKYIQVYNPDDLNDFPIVIPVVFGLLGIIAIVVATVYHYRVNKRRNVEVADFGFHGHRVNKQSWRSKFSRTVKYYTSIFTNKRSGPQTWQGLDGSYGSVTT